MRKSHEPISLFEFLRQERISLLLLSFIAVLIFGFSDKIIETFDRGDSEKIQAETQLSELEKAEEPKKRNYQPNQKYANQEWSNKPRKKFPKKKLKNEIKTESLFEFDPNEATHEQFVQLGLLPRVATMIEKYRKKGGKFFRKEDFKKIYGITDADYELLEPFIRIEQAPPKAAFAKQEKKFEKPPAKKPEVVFIDINTATKEEWQKLKGIGPYYSDKITRFREKLGGFSSIEQISMTYGLKDSTFQVIKPFLKPSPVFRKIKINHVDAKTLSSHPYLKWNQANVLKKYQENHGAILDIETFSKIAVFSKEDIEKLEPYLDFSP